MTIPYPKRVKLTHPMADEISIATHSFAYAGENTSELAFFMNGQWVVQPIPEFAQYHDGTPLDHDTAVYGWVPNKLIDTFLEEYKA